MYDVQSVVKNSMTTNIEFKKIQEWAASAVGGYISQRKKSRRPSEHDSVEFGPDGLQQFRVEDVLTQAERAPVTGAHAAQPGVAEERHREDTHPQNTHTLTKQTGRTPQSWS